VAGTVRHYTWGMGARCRTRFVGSTESRLEDVTCGSCLRLIALDRIDDAEAIAVMGGEEFLELRRWAAKVNARRA
jgi:hypothetical protein